MRNSKKKSVGNWIELNQSERDYLKRQCSVNDAELDDSLRQYNEEIDAQIKSGELTQKEFFISMDDAFDEFIEM